MTEYEQEQLMTQSFEYLWCELWKNNEPNPRDKIRMTPDKWKHTVLKGNTATETSHPSDNERVAGANSVGYDRICRNGMEANQNGCESPSSTPSTTGDSAEYDETHPEPDTYYDNGKINTKDKFNILQKGLVFNQKKHFTIAEIVNEVRKEKKSVGAEQWKEPEWGFCKGRRNYKENDFDCAVREMQEETGYSKEYMTPVKNINTFEEIFIGSNFKCYKHKYYLMHMTYEDSLKTGVFEKTEVSCIRWASLNECLGLIRSYNVEKKRLITNIDNALSNYAIFESR